MSDRAAVMLRHVAADDRTGALETAAALADRLDPSAAADGVVVTSWPDTGADLAWVADVAGRTVVVDLGSRYLPESEARRRAGALLPAGPAAHKIDSTLRGNWAAEVAARCRAQECAAMVVPALPMLGRTCLEGEVRLDGTPIANTWAGVDARGGIRSSRPGEHLAAFGIPAAHARWPDDVDRWAALPGTAIVCDATCKTDLEALADVWRNRSDVLLAGSSAAIAATSGVHPAPPVAVPEGRLLVVCASLNPVARAQLAALDGVDGVAVCATPDVTAGVSDDAALAAADSVCAQGRARLATERFAAVVVIGGDTAAAWLGDERAFVRGSAGPGMAYLEPGRDGLPVITRAGGFGESGDLARLVSGRLRS